MKRRGTTTSTTSLMPPLPTQRPDVVRTPRSIRGSTWQWLYGTTCPRVGVVLSCIIMAVFITHYIHIAIRRHDYEWASFESYGFFTDLDRATWRRHQQRVHEATHVESLYYNHHQDQSDPPLNNDTAAAAWLMQNVHPFFTCPNLRRLGGHGDGAKWTCDPHRLVQQTDCLIYSIGSSGSYVFEDTIGSYTGNQCEIHVFDPEPSYARINDTIHRNIHYHAWGLQSSRVQKQITKKKYKWRLEYMNIYEIIQQLGHENRRIDILKIDCELCEWTTYPDWLFTSQSRGNSNTTSSMNHSNTPRADIRQILIETHGLPSKDSGGPYAFFNTMIENHYVLFSKEANTHPGARPYGLFYEWSWLKLHPNFFI